MKEALSGIRILDLGRVLSAPFCASILSDLGAEVIKIENPNSGDETRDYSPQINGESGYFINFNRGKKGITLNLKDIRGKALFLELVKKADVVLENFRPGVMDRLGLGYSVLSKENPKIIYASISGFGSTGPYCKRGGYDTVAQAMSGMMSMTGQVDGLPTRVGASIADVTTGLNAAIGILAAIHFRERSGHGQVVEVSLIDSAVVNMASVVQEYFTSGKVPDRKGNQYDKSSLGGVYHTKDGYIAVCGIGKNNWEKLCIVMKQENFAAITDDTINLCLSEWALKYNTEEILNILWKCEIPASTVLNVDEVLDNPQIISRKMFTKLEQPIAGIMNITAPAIKMSESNPFIHCHAPLLGQHNEDIYSSILNLTHEDIKDMQAKNII